MWCKNWYFKNSAIDFLLLLNCYIKKTISLMMNGKKMYVIDLNILRCCVKVYCMVHFCLRLSVKRVPALFVFILTIWGILKLYPDAVNTLYATKVYVPPCCLLWWLQSYGFCSHICAYISIHSKFCNAISAR